VWFGLTTERPITTLSRTATEHSFVVGPDYLGGYIPQPLASELGLR
jgi:hypothetical protein